MYNTNPWVGNIVETEAQKQAFRTVRQIEQHLGRIKQINYKVSQSVVDELQKIEDNLDAVAGDIVWRSLNVQ